MQAVAKSAAKVNRSQALRRPLGQAERREVRKNFEGITYEQPMSLEKLPEKIFKKLFKNLLTSQKECGIITRSALERASDKRSLKIEQ